MMKAWQIAQRVQAKLGFDPRTAVYAESKLSLALQL